MFVVTHDDKSHTKTETQFRPCKPFGQAACTGKTYRSAAIFANSHVLRLFAMKLRTSDPKTWSYMYPLSTRSELWISSRQKSSAKSSRGHQFLFQT